MSDLSLQLQKAQSQLPVSAYFDEALYAREMATLFADSPRYVGHTLTVPEPGNFHTLPQEHQGRALVHTPKGVELISNVCRHRQAVILQGRGALDAQTGGNIVCPLHRWTYAAADPRTTGTLIGAPHFAQDPCLNLHNYPLEEWNGLLFETRADGAGRSIAADLATLGPRMDLDFSGYALTGSNCTSATTTGRPSSRSTSRTTTSARSIPASAAS